MFKYAKALALCSLGLIQTVLAQMPREVWIDPALTAVYPAAPGTIASPLGGSGASFDQNMAILCAGSGPGSPTYPNLVIHLKAGTFTTVGGRANLTPSWALRAGQRLVGEGIDRT